MKLLERQAVVTTRQKLSRLPGIGFFRDLREAYQHWQRDDGHLLAAAVAYYAALSFFPVMLVLISGLGVFLQFTALGQNAQQQVLSAIAEHSSPALEQQVGSMLERVQTNAAIGGPLGLLGILLTAVALFAQFETAFDRIWNVEDRETRGVLNAVKNIVFHRLRAFLMLLGLGGLIIAIFIAGILLSTLQAYTEAMLPAAEWIWWFVQTAVSVGLNTIVFTMIYTILPKVPVRWSEGFRGGLLAAVVWEIGRMILAAFLIGNKYSAYGVVGSFIAVLLWIYYAATVIFLGAEYVQVICRRCNPSAATDRTSSDRAARQDRNRTR